MLKSSKSIMSNEIPTAVVGVVVSAPVVQEVQTIQVKPIGTSLALVDPKNIRSVEDLGEKYSSVLQNLSSSLNTSDTKLKTMGAVGNNIAALMSTVKSLDPSMINQKPGLISKFFGKAKDGITMFIDTQKTVDQSVQEVSTRLLNDRQELINENIALEKTYTENLKVLDEMENIIKIGQNDVLILKQELQQFQDARPTLNTEDALEVQNRKHFIERVEQKLSRIDNGRALALRQLPQIMIMQSANNTEIDTIKDVVDVAVPLWKSQLNLYISQLKTKNAVETRQAVTSVINETIQQNAILMNQNVTDIAAGYSSDIITADTIKVVNDNLLSSINTMADCQKNAQQKRIESFNNIKAMDNELKQLQLKN